MTTDLFVAISMLAVFGGLTILDVRKKEQKRKGQEELARHIVESVNELVDPQVAHLNREEKIKQLSQLVNSFIK